MTPEQPQPRCSTGGVGFEASEAVLADDAAHDQREPLGNTSAYVDWELTDEELLAIWESTVAGVSDGSIPTFDDKEALLEDVLRRLGR